MQLVRHPPSVAIVAVDGDEIVLVRQTRPGAKERTLEVPSGKLEPGEAPHEAAARELAEECGLAATALQEIGAFWAVPAYSTEFVHVFEATGLQHEVSPRLDADEDVEVERLPAARALEAVSDAVSLAALALWRQSR
jgi:ADP-ribose pyrophosphatase